MTDHIVVFDGSERLVGRTVRVGVREASAFTLFGDVETGEYAAGELAEREPAARATRLALPLV